MEKCYLSATIGSALTISLLDYIWLGYFQKDNWAKQISSIQGSLPNYKTNGMIITYVIMLVCIITLAISRTRKESLLKDSIIWGFFVGLAMYGVFNGTNYTIFSNYSLETAMKDTAWGVYLSIVTTIVGGYLSEYVKIL